MNDWRLDWQGDTALRVQLADQAGPVVTAQVRALDQTLQRMAWPAVRAVVPGPTTVLLHVDPVRTARDALEDAVRALVLDVTLAPVRDHALPVVYDGEDLRAIAEQTAHTPEEVVALHTAATYEVTSVGFAPGFAYLSGLDPVLHVPRRASPRSHIAAGSVIVAAGLTAVMPAPMPSGWHVLGRLCLPVDAQPLFDTDRRPPARLQPGDRVRFVPVPP